VFIKHSLEIMMSSKDFLKDRCVMISCVACVVLLV
jgi:hypothetical protein